MQETSVWVAINGTRRIALSCSPHQREALALGQLLTEGWIGSVRDVLSLTPAEGPGGACGVHVQLDAAQVDLVLAAQRHRVSHGCGLRHTIDCGDAGAAGAGGTLPPAAASAHGASRGAAVVDSGPLFRLLFAAADEAAPDGGVHAAAVSDGRTLGHTAVDVARHCAVDRAIGLALQDGAELGALGVVLTARISGSMALKCARAGLAWAASRSVATSLAHELAAAHGLQLIERAARRAAE
jgi:FdhD protein